MFRCLIICLLAMFSTACAASIGAKGALGTSGDPNGTVYAELSPMLIPTIGIETGRRSLDTNSTDEAVYNHYALYLGFKYPFFDGIGLYSDEAVFVTAHLGPMIGSDANGAMFELGFSYLIIQRSYGGPSFEFRAGYRLEHLTGFTDKHMAEPESNNHHMFYIGIGIGFWFLPIHV